MASGWTHALCDEDYQVVAPGREPARINEDHRKTETCCLCGKPTRSGIYYRADPQTMPHCPGHM